jgi:hypothetical protein
MAWWGHIHAYIVEIISRWLDSGNADYNHGFLDYAFNKDITIPAYGKYVDSTVWDGSSWNSPDLVMDNIKIILAVFNSEWHQGYADPPSNRPFDAYYCDETIAVEPIESNPPEILNIDPNPIIQEVDDWVNISCDVTATFGLNNVNVIITNPDLSTDNITMINFAGTDTYYYNTTYTNSGEYDFYIWAEDLNDDTTTSTSYSFEIGIPPEISQEIANPNIQQNGNQVNLTCSVIDNVLVNTVTVNLTDPNDITNTYTMNSAGRSDEYYYDAVYTVDGIHRFFIEAVDNNDNVAYSAIHYFYIGDDGVSFDLDIGVGWNLITMPIDYDMMASNLAESIKDCLSVNRWDALNQTYRPYIVGIPALDFPINPGIGLFVDTETIGDIIFVGPPALDVSIDLEIGWNLVGWYNVSSTMASSLAENISGCESVNAWDALNQTYRPYIVGIPALDFVVTPGMGLFVDVTTESTWTGEG